MKSNITGQASIIINAPTSKVWEALTTPELIKEYFFGTDAISDWKEGSPLIFKGIWQGKEYEDKGVILNSEPEKLFRYKYWSSMSGTEDKEENYVNITYKLSEIANGTLLQITQDNIPDEKMKEHSEENWKTVLNGLKELLESDPVTG
ncbi:MAG: SRPBCC family protein [Bacteroidota bacterium]